MSNEVPIVIPSFEPPSGLNPLADSMPQGAIPPQSPPIDFLPAEMRTNRYQGLKTLRSKGRAISADPATRNLFNQTINAMSSVPEDRVNELSDRVTANWLMDNFYGDDAPAVREAVEAVVMSENALAEAARKGFGSFKGFIDYTFRNPWRRMRINKEIADIMNRTMDEGDQLPENILNPNGSVIPNIRSADETRLRELEEARNEIDSFTVQGLAHIADPIKWTVSMGALYIMNGKEAGLDTLKYLDDMAVASAGTATIAAASGAISGGTAPAAALATLKAGGEIMFKANLIKEMYELERGLAYYDFSKAGLDHDKAKTWATTVGVFNAVMEALGMNMVVGGIKKIGAKAARNIITDQAQKIAGDAVEGAVTKGVTRAATDQAKRSATAQVFKGVSTFALNSALPEGATETAQSMAVTLAEYVQREAQDMETQGVLKEGAMAALQEGLQAFVATMVTGGLAQGAAMTPQAVRRMGQSARKQAAISPDTLAAAQEQSLQRLKEAGGDIITLAKPISIDQLEQQARGWFPEIVEEYALNGLDGDSISMLDAFTRFREVFFGNRDTRQFAAGIQVENLQAELKSAVKDFQADAYKPGNEWDFDEALRTYIELDLKNQDVDTAIATWLETRELDALPAWWNDRTWDMIDLADNLPPRVREVGDKIGEMFEELGREAKIYKVIGRTRKNYVAREWKQPEGRPETRHFKQRIFETWLDGAALGWEIRERGVTNDLGRLQEVIIEEIERKRFFEAMMKTKDVNGDSLVTYAPRNMRGYAKVNVKSFDRWFSLKMDELAGAKDIDIEQQMDLMDELELGEGALDLKQKVQGQLFARKDIARNLNNTFGEGFDGGLMGMAQKISGTIKSMIFTTSFFHHLALARSYMLGAKLGKDSWNPVQAYRTGQDMIHAFSPELMLGIKNGLTIGRNNEWVDTLRARDRMLKRGLKRMGMSDTNANRVAQLRERWDSFLFNKYGAGLKAMAFLNEFKLRTEKSPGKDMNEVAAEVANLINDDFGGLHLERMGRNPKLQQVLRLALLAPDWTESNLRTLTKVFGLTWGAGAKTQDGRLKRVDVGTITSAEWAEYATFWGRAAVRGTVFTVLSNLALAGIEGLSWEEMVERFWEAWQADPRKLRFMEVDMTWIYKIMGLLDDPNEKRYFNLVGHFKDPLKWILDPGRSIQHKGGPLGSAVGAAMRGRSWNDQRFSSFLEWRATGRRTQWDDDAQVFWQYFPAWAAEEILGAIPIPMQAALDFATGQINALDMVMTAAGARPSMARTPSKSWKKRRDKREKLRRQIALKRSMR